MESVGMTVAMVISQILDVGKNTIVKKATNNGMSQFVFILYTNVLSLFVLLPSTFLYYRNRGPPPISACIIGKILLFAFLGYAGQICLYEGMGLSSPTLVSAMLDLMPAFTFIFAVVSRMENLDLRVRSSQAKCVGTMVSIVGALVVTLYRGLPITILPQLPHHHHQPNGILLSHQPNNWLLGGILLAISSVCISLINIVQTWILKDYPTELMVATISFSFSTILSAVVAFFTQRNPKYWILRPNVELSAIFYTALFQAFILIVMYGWACRKKGPLYVAIFSPFGIVIALCMGIVFLGDTLFLGRMIGCVIIAVGFYGVIWGIAQERKKMVNHNNNEISTYVSSSTPLLYNKSTDT
ncbi:WAT1-related protein [Senna tora]|uniref:WAT1-related protein n=1 Tax=Senna tora TaxID=362788 RepID=A0A834SIQ2_9FABA|nr:WAT1-related protein [Senna tora]